MQAPAFSHEPATAFSHEPATAIVWPKAASTAPGQPLAFMALEGHDQRFPVVPMVEEMTGWEDRLRERQLNVIKHGWWTLPDGNVHPKMPAFRLASFQLHDIGQLPNGAPCLDVFIPSWARP